MFLLWLCKKKLCYNAFEKTSCEAAQPFNMIILQLGVLRPPQVSTTL